MKRLKIAITVLALTLGLRSVAQDAGTTTTTTSTAPSASARGLNLSLGVNGGLPIGTFHDQSKYKFGVGGSAQLGIPVSSTFDLTLSAGYMAFGQTAISTVVSGKTFSIIPIQGGVRYMMPSGFYIHPKAGYTQTKRQGIEGVGQFSYAAYVGYLINKMIDVSAGYEAIHANSDQTIAGVSVPGVDPKFIGVRIAYNINFARVK